MEQDDASPKDEWRASRSTATIVNVALAVSVLAVIVLMLMTFLD